MDLFSRVRYPGSQRPSSPGSVSPFNVQASEQGHQNSEEIDEAAYESDSSESESDNLPETQIQSATAFPVGSDSRTGSSALPTAWGMTAPNIGDFNAMLEAPSDQYLNSPYFVEQILHNTSQFEYPSFHEFSPNILVTPPTDNGHQITPSGAEQRTADEGVSPAIAPVSTTLNLSATESTLGKRGQSNIGKDTTGGPDSRRRRHE